jgi:hypothetical protein
VFDVAGLSIRYLRSELVDGHSARRVGGDVGGRCKLDDVTFSAIFVSTPQPGAVA